MISAKRAKRIAKSKYPSKRKAQRDELHEVMNLIHDSCKRGNFNCGICTSYESTHIKLLKLGYDVEVKRSPHNFGGYGLTINWY